MPDTLLIVEDEKLLGNELRRHFERSDWQVELVTNIGDAERMLLEFQLQSVRAEADRIQAVAEIERITGVVLLGRS